MGRVLPLLGEMPRGAASAAWHGERDAEGETRRGTDAAPETTSRVRPDRRATDSRDPSRAAPPSGSRRGRRPRDPTGPYAMPYAPPPGPRRHATATAHTPGRNRTPPLTPAWGTLWLRARPAGHRRHRAAPPHLTPAPQTRDRGRERVSRRRAPDAGLCRVASRDDRTSACHTPILGQDQKCVLGVHAGNNKISSPWGEAPHSTVYGCW